MAVHELLVCAEAPTDGDTIDPGGLGGLYVHLAVAYVDGAPRLRFRKGDMS